MDIFQRGSVNKMRDMGFSEEYISSYRKQIEHEKKELEKNDANKLAI